MVVDIYGNSGKQNGQRRSQKWIPFTRRLTEGERGRGAAAAAGRMDIGRSMGPGTRHDQHEARVTVNAAERGLCTRDAKTGHVSGLPFTVSCLYKVSLGLSQ